MIRAMKKNKAYKGHRGGDWGLQHYVRSQGKASRRSLHGNTTLRDAFSKDSFFENCNIIVHSLKGYQQRF